MPEALEPILHVAGLRVTFPGVPNRTEVVHGIDVCVGRERVALVGESGSGKSVTARAILNLLPPGGRLTADRLTLGGRNLLQLSSGGWAALRGSAIGFVPQDPRFSLNPSQTIGRQVAEALVLHTRLGSAARRARVLAMLERVGFTDPSDIAKLRPGQLSGGMGQRAMIAAMLINEPRLVIADEPTSALDGMLRDHVLGLLGRLAADSGSGLLLISHDLPQVARFADRALVMRNGAIVDARPAVELAHADHPHTRALWAAQPSAATYGTKLPVLPRHDAGVTA